MLGPRLQHDQGPWPLEGEQRNMWEADATGSLVVPRGNLHQSRHYSQYLSLQLKARQAGIDTPVYGMTNAAPVLNEEGRRISRRPSVPRFKIGPTQAPPRLCPPDRARPTSAQQRRQPLAGSDQFDHLAQRRVVLPAAGI